MNQAYGRFRPRRPALGIPGGAVAPLDYPDQPPGGVEWGAFFRTVAKTPPIMKKPPPGYGESWWEWGKSWVQSSAATVGIGLAEVGPGDIPAKYRRAPADDYEAYEQVQWFYATAARLADYHGAKDLQARLYRYQQEAAQGRADLVANPRRLLGFGPKGKRLDILKAASLAIVPLTATAPTSGAHHLVAQISQNAAEPLAERQTRKWLLVALALGTAAVLFGGGGLVFWRMRKNPRKKMSTTERAVRVGVGGTVAAIGTLGWLGPQVAEPVSTLAGGAATLGGLGLMATGLTGQAGLGKKLIGEIKG